MSASGPGRYLAEAQSAGRGPFLWQETTAPFCAAATDFASGNWTSSEQFLEAEQWLNVRNTLPRGTAAAPTASLVVLRKPSVFGVSRGRCRPVRA